MKKILIVGMFRFPYGDAISNRYMGLAKSILASNSRLLIVANGASPGGTGEIVNADGVDYLTIRSKGDGFFSKSIRRIFPEFYYYNNAKLFSAGGVDYCIVPLGSLSLKLIFLCRYIWKCKLVVDCMEWFDANQFRFGVLSFDYLKFQFNFNVSLYFIKNIISISNLINTKFNKIGRNIIKIPPQVVVNNFVNHSAVSDCSKIKVLYAGSVGSKDYLGVMLRGLMLLSESERLRIIFTIAGPSRKELNNLFLKEFLVPGEVWPVINSLGRISRDSVLSELSNSHFSVLLRPVARYSSAGFPSKIPESLAAGTPVICNITSDLGDYLVDGKNSILVEGCTPEFFAKALRRALMLSVDNISDMSHEAKKCAVENFDFSVMVKNINVFLHNCK